MMILKKANPFLILLLFFIAGCEENYLPKPKGYIRIDVPPKKYRPYLPEDCPFHFKIHEKAVVNHRTPMPGEKCWLNIDYPDFKATIHLSYKPVQGNLPQLIEESRSLVYKHTIKANNIEENIINVKNHRVYGMEYYLEGDVASYLQFYVTDSSQNFIRGALYFNVPSNFDSLFPLTQYIRKDLDTLIYSLQWK